MIYNKARLQVTTCMSMKIADVCKCKVCSVQFSLCGMGIEVERPLAECEHVVLKNILICPFETMPKEEIF